ncbi:MAG: DUF4405 domain-containing protein [Planctomycetaceae bacterium]|nr:DUF4405 domain-containing protein [Planctomycetaceae bacterium]
MIAAGSADRSGHEDPHADNSRVALPHPPDRADELSVARPSSRSGTVRKRVSRTLINFWLDAVLGILFVLLCLTAVIVQFVFPPGVAARGVTLWGGSYGHWCSLQFTLIAILGLGVLVHVMLHWSWVCSVLTRRILRTDAVLDDGLRTIYGVGLLIGLLLGGATVIGIAQWMIVLP